MQDNAEIYSSVDVACSTGWLTHWGEPMANTSLDQFIDTLHQTLGFADNTGSVNLYMAHGGTNFGYTAGACSTPTHGTAIVFKDDCQALEHLSGSSCVLLQCYQIQHWSVGKMLLNAHALTMHVPLYQGPGHVHVMVPICESGFIAGAQLSSCVCHDLPSTHE